jgi:hypothetical protein
MSREEYGLQDPLVIKEGDRKGERVLSMM